MWHRNLGTRLTSWTRRRFSAALAGFPVVLLASSMLPLRRAAAGTPLTAAQADTLERIGWLLFPFPGLGDAPYARAVDAIVAAASDAGTAELIESGIADLDGGTAGTWLRLDEPAQVERLRGIESGPFFAYMLATTKAQLFNNREVWAHIGYEGSSLEHGGYVGRGLSDIGWLDDGPER